MLSAISRFGRFNSRNIAVNTSTRSFAATLDGYGKYLFKGAVAAPYLEKHGLPKNTLDLGKWTTDGNADKVRNFINV